MEPSQKTVIIAVVIVVAILVVAAIGYAIYKEEDAVDSLSTSEHALNQGDSSERSVGGGGTDTDSRADVDDGEAAEGETVQESADVEFAPDFTLEQLGGGEVTLSDFRGKKAVILDFWASWCPNCQRDMPKLSALRDQYADQLEVIGVNLQETERTVQRFDDEYNIAFPLVFDPSGDVAADYGVIYTNVHVLINKEGEIVGVVPRDITEQDIQNLLAE